MGDPGEALGQKPRENQKTKTNDNPRGVLGRQPWGTLGEPWGCTREALEELVSYKGYSNTLMSTSTCTFSVKMAEETVAAGPVPRWEPRSVGWGHFGSSLASK